MRQVDLRTEIRPFLEQLVEELGETAHLIVREGVNSRFLESVEGTHALRTTARVGTAYPAMATSGGKALLAELDEAELFEHLHEARARGYATNEGETILGIFAIGMVQRASTGRIAGALAVLAPEVRVTETRREQIVEVLRRVTAEAQRRLP